MDTWLRLKAPQEARDVVIVGITDDDYKDLFGSKSPLWSYPLGALIRAIASGGPAVIGIDLDKPQ